MNKLLRLSVILAMIWCSLPILAAYDFEYAEEDQILSNTIIEKSNIVMDIPVQSLSHKEFSDETVNSDTDICSNSRVSTLTYIEMSPKITEAVVGSVRKFSVKFKTSDGQVEGVKVQLVWSSSDTKIANFGVSDGEIIFLKKGTVTITVASKDNPDIKDSCTITVTEKNHVSVTKVDITIPSYTADEGTLTKFEAVVYPSNATNKTLKWSSDDSNIVDINAYTGEAVLVNPGTTFVRVTCEDNIFVKDAIEVTVTKNSRFKLSLTHTELTEVVGNTITLKAYTTPTSAINNYGVKWTSSDPSVARIQSSSSTECTLFLSSPGESILTATCDDKTAECKIKVTKPSPNPTSSISLDKQYYSGVSGTSFNLRASFTPSSLASGATWSTSDESILRVLPSSDKKSCTVTLLKAGNASVYIKSGSVSASCNVDVTTEQSYEKEFEIYYNGEALSDIVEGTPDTSAQLYGRLNGQDISGAEIAWSSSNQDIATISRNGLLKLKYYGFSEITGQVSGNSRSFIVMVCSESPLALPAQNITKDSFIASWAPVSNANGYLFDLQASIDGEVFQYVEGYEELDVEFYHQMKFEEIPAEWKKLRYAVKAYDIYGTTTKLSNWQVVDMQNSSIAPTYIDSILPIISIAKGGIIINAEDKLETTIFDLSGRIVYHGRELSIDLSPGIYLLKRANVFLKILVP